MEGSATTEANGAATAASKSEAAVTAVAPSAAPRSKAQRTQRPNYAVIHARPLPLSAHPLPTLIPHNPLSIFYFTITFLKQLFSPPTSHTQIYRGYFSPETRSVHVTEEESIRGLWENGFFGKGTLSRSEPSWLDREKRRLGITVEETAEEITARRRVERKAFKTERARKEREERERQHAAGSEIAQAMNEDRTSDQGNRADETPPLDANTQDTTQQLSERVDTKSTPILPEPQTTSTLVNQEHLQLELVEVLFLVYALGVLEVYDSTTHELIPTSSLFHLCLAHAHFPPLPLPLKAPQPRPDNPFFITYATYHHFRSLGWVVRNGVKFGADLLLYQRGPVFAHAEFAVIIVPSYTHSYWESEGAQRPKPWHWLHMVNRVQAQVRKTLVLCFVNVPPPLEHEELYDAMDLGKVLRQYQVREMVLKRWVPNRSRD